MMIIEVQSFRESMYDATPYFLLLLLLSWTLPCFHSGLLCYCFLKMCLSVMLLKLARLYPILLKIRFMAAFEGFLLLTIASIIIAESPRIIQSLISFFLRILAPISKLYAFALLFEVSPRPQSKEKNISPPGSLMFPQALALPELFLEAPLKKRQNPF